MSFMRKHYKFSEEIQNQLMQLRELDNWHGLIAVCYDYVVIAAAVALFCLNKMFYPLSIILIGSRQRALATILHESAHRCIAKNPVLNRFIGTYLSGYLILQEYDTYCESHVKQHHGWLGDATLDPDYKYYRELGLYEYKGCLGFFITFVLKPLLLLKVGSYFNYLLQHRIKPNPRYLKGFYCMVAYWVCIIAVLFYFSLLNYFILLWLIPLLTTANVFGWFNEVAEHYPLVGQYNTDINMSRNRFSHWVEHFLFNTHNENYHLVHHLRATIPFWNLAKAHEILEQDPEYAALNSKMGGIFLSGNDNPSLMKQFLMEPSINRAGVIQQYE